MGVLVLFRRFLCLTVLVCFLGALALTAYPLLHEKQHTHASSNHHSSDECNVCHILGHFVADDVATHALVLANQDFLILKSKSYTIPQLTYLPSALIPRAPPII